MSAFRRPFPQQQPQKKDAGEKSSASPPSLASFVSTSLGQRGYSILKSEGTAQQLQYLRTHLMARPMIPGAPVQTQKKFPIYRESEKKFYVPRFYGEAQWGVAKTNQLPPGTPISLTFNGALREIQLEPVNAYLNHVRAGTGGAGGGGSGLLELYCGFGKTSITLYFIAELGLKTLIIVHKDFLMKQWVERIQQFLPGARIGTIQGPVVDIDNKDIVICMLQSLSMKDYPTSTFASFGFTVIDEVHHIGSEVFSCALFKITTRYMLGLSATMNRKDGTTKVFKLFLGDIVCSKKREGEDGVVVRSIVYKPADAEFNKLEMDARGNVALAKMMGKICEYSFRSEFILRVLTDMLAENPRQQIMIIAAYRNILKYLHDAIVHRNIATVGYYLGGMKEKALKETETKQVVLATYSMAAEGLDIKSLTTLMMATPMTNIEQSVGRILREKHEFAPVVVDFVDGHENFQKQWMKRKRFYKSQNYKIVQTTHWNYTPNPSCWQVVYDPAPASHSICGKRKADVVDADDDEDDEEDDDQGEEETGDDGGALPKGVIGKCLLAPPGASRV